MKIKDFLFKFKRTMRRNKKAIGRGISIVLILFLAVIVGYVSYNIYQADQIRAAEAEKEIPDDGIVIAPGWNYGEPGFNKVAENANLMLEADYTTGEIRVTDKTSGKQWYSNPPDRDSDKIIAMRTRINSQIHVKFNNLKTHVELDIDNAVGSIRRGGMSHELVENGIKFTFAFPQSDVIIPVQYTILEDSFQAEVLTNEIKSVGSNPSVIQSITLLPYFGAGGLEDEGYLFVPDGSGSLIEFNNGRQRTSSYNAMVYGDNITLTGGKESTVREKISMPIFGAKNGDHAFLGVIISGDANSSISASTSRKTSSYNTVYSSCLFTEYNLVKKVADETAGKNAMYVDVSKDLMAGKNYAVRYFFLNGEDANYTGMSNSYRNFLLENNLLKKSELADDKYLILDIIGAVTYEKYVFGIKKPVITPLTTYNQVCTIVKELKERGVDKLIINYIGACEKGMNNVMYDQVTNVSALGTKKEFRNMIEYLEKENVQLFLETNPIDIYKNGNGVNGTRDSVETFFNSYAFQYNYKLDTEKQIDEERWYLLHPERVPEMTAKFAESLASWKVDNISLSRLGEVLYSDYDRDDEHTNRMESLALWEEALKAASANSEHVLVHGGNVYCAPYADIITDVADTHSDYDMEDQTVPFYQMVFQNNYVVTSYGINTTVDYDQAFMKTLESGTNLKYNLIYGDVAQLVGTKYNTMVSYSYEYWKDIIVEQYHKLQEFGGTFAGEEITYHEYLADDVTLTVYETGKIVVNYSNEAYTYQGVKIEPRSYLVLPGGAK